MALVFLQVKEVLIAKVEWVAVNSPLTNNDNPGKGLRIFADKDTPTDTINRKLIKAQATLNQKVKDIVIAFSMFDVDDPSSNDPAVDNEKDNTDNRSKTRFKTILIRTNADGIAESMFELGVQPGDNYRVVAALGLPSHLEAIQDDGDKARIRYQKTGAIVPTADAKLVASEILTVWRRLHVERDSMAAPRNDEVFKGAGVGDGTTEGDDDVRFDPGDPGVALMQLNYRDAYIEVMDDLGSLNIKKETQFVHNLEFASKETVGNAAAIGNASRDVKSAIDFWVVQILGAYEGLSIRDFDPPIGDRGVLETAMLGFTPKPGHPFDGLDGPCLIFLETIRDVRAYRGLLQKPVVIPETVLVERTAFHESVHRFNMYHAQGGPDPKNPGDQGPLIADPNNLYGTDADNKLTPAQLGVIRGEDRPK